MEKLGDSGAGNPAPYQPSSPTEQFPVLPNLPGSDSSTGRLIFSLRLAADLMVASVVRYLKSWLSIQNGSVLDVGCGAQPYRHLLPAGCHYQGLDWEGSQDHFAYHSPNTIYYDGDKFPFDDGQFDALFATEVIEHVWDYQYFLNECRRVLKPGGAAFFSIPFAARYHYIPNDYWRFTPATLKKILTEAGFASIIIRTRGTDFTVAAYKLVSITYRWLQGKIYQRILGILSLPFVAISLLVGQVTMRWSIGSQDDCLGYVVTAKANPDQMREL
jgi:SAM-dependent methyltransferase